MQFPVQVGLPAPDSPWYAAAYGGETRKLSALRACNCDYVFEPQNIEHGISNFEVLVAVQLLRFEIPCSIFDILHFVQY